MNAPARPGNAVRLLVRSRRTWIVALCVVAPSIAAAGWAHPANAAPSATSSAPGSRTAASPAKRPPPQQRCPIPGTDLKLTWTPFTHRNWFANHFLRDGQEFLLADAKELTCEECGTYRLEAVSPGPVTAQLAPIPFILDAEKRCVATARWRLPDVPGDYQFYARVTQTKASGTGAQTTNAVASVKAGDATAHVPASLVVGLGYLFHDIRGVPDDANAERRRRRLQPMVGVDVPFIVRDWGCPWARAIIGTAFGDPGFDLYTGLELLPLFDGARAAAFPLQVSAGARMGFKAHGSPFVALHLNATSALGNLAGGFVTK